MSKDSFTNRFAEALRRSGLSPTEIAQKAGTTDATISNWLNDKVQPDHLKASLLLKIAIILDVDPYELLFGEQSHTKNRRVGETTPAYLEQSQVLNPEALRMALQLASDMICNKGLTLPPEKHADLVTLMYELLEEGLPEAKVLRFARVAAA